MSKLSKERERLAAANHQAPSTTSRLPDKYPPRPPREYIAAAITGYLANSTTGVPNPALVEANAQRIFLMAERLWLKEQEVYGPDET